MSLLDEFTQGFANAIDDIRNKVVEQGWTGQQQTYGGTGGWADTKGVEAAEQPTESNIEAPEIGVEPTEAEMNEAYEDIDPPPIEIPEDDLMEMFTPPTEAEQGLDQGQDIEQDIDM